MAESTLSVTSSLFADDATIPASAAHTMAGGQNVSPDLSWTAGPPETRSYALLCHDPDAPTDVGFTHWVLFNVDAGTTSLAAGAGAPGRQPAGSVQGFTDWGESCYGGMAPPPGDTPHRYRFTIYALDVPGLDVDGTTTLAKLQFLIRGHVLARGTLTGRFGIKA